MFLVVGDIHNLALKVLLDIIDKEKPDFVLQTGDFGLYDEQTDIETLIPPEYRFEAENLQFPFIRDGKIKLNAPVYFILGNHDDYKMPERYEGLKEKGFKNLRLLDENPLNLGGYKICGLSGNYGGKSFEKNYRRKPNHILREDLEKFNKPFDILVMHESPHPEFTPPLFEFVIKHKPKFVFHGHIHEKKISEINGIKIISLPLLATLEYIRVNDDLSWEWRKYNPGMPVEIFVFFQKGLETILAIPENLKLLYYRLLDRAQEIKFAISIKYLSRKAGYKISFKEIIRAVKKGSKKISDELKKRPLLDDEKWEMWEEILSEELKLEERTQQGKLKRVSMRTFMKSLSGKIDYDEAEEIVGHKELTPKQIEILLKTLGDEEYLEEPLDILDNLGEEQYQPELTKVIRGGEYERATILIHALKVLADYGNEKILPQLNKIKEDEKNSNILPWYLYAIESIKKRSQE